jgi:hypothetical protein
MANASLELTGSQCETAKKLALMMKVVAVVLLVLGAITLIGGLLTPVSFNFHDIVLVWLATVVEGAVTCLLGLIMLSSSANIQYMVETKYASLHLGHAFKDLTALYLGQFLLALFLIVVLCARFFVG